MTTLERALHSHAILVKNNTKRNYHEYPPRSYFIRLAHKYHSTPGDVQDTFDRLVKEAPILKYHPSIPLTWVTQFEEVSVSYDFGITSEEDRFVIEGWRSKKVSKKTKAGKVRAVTEWEVADTRYIEVRKVQ